MKIALWAAVLVAPLLSVVVMGQVAGTSVFALDAWNTNWNDELHYYWTVSQMRTVGYPSAMAGYNEVPAALPSFGPYSMFAYVPYYLGSFFTGVDSHNFMYILNMAFGVVSAAIVVLVLRPDVRQSVCLVALYGFQFIVARHLCSGMTEADHLLFAAIFTSCALLLATSYCDGHAPAKATAAIAVMAAALGFWGLIRPYLLAFVLAPVLLLVLADFGFSKGRKAVLLAVLAVAAIGALAGYLYISKMHIAPYFETQTIANSLFERLGTALSGLPGLHVEWFVFLGESLAKLQWEGVMALLFALALVALVYFAVRARRLARRAEFALALGMLVAGAAIFEANLMLYSAELFDRMLIGVNAMYALVVIWLGARQAKGGRHASGESRSFASLRAGYLAVLVVACTASLVASPADFSLPQANEKYSAASEEALAVELADKMPFSEDPWDNTVIHPIETRTLQVYFCMPRYTNQNCCKRTYIAKGIQDGTLKSKYLCLPGGHELNDMAKSHYKILYKGTGHFIYQLR